MNTPFRLPVVEDDFLAAVAAVNCWRGRCLDAFAAAELAVSEALLRLPAGDKSPRLPHLVGARMQRLANLLNAAGATALAEALQRVRAHDPLRTMLCHGKAIVTLDRGRRWHAIFRTIRCSGATETRNVLVVDEAEADRLARDLAAASRRLADLLRAFPLRDDDGDRGG